MKKEFFDNTALFSFFIRIPCKTNKQSVQCKQSASWSAGPLSNFFRAFIETMSTALVSSSERKKDACMIVAQMLYIKHAAFCNSLDKLKSTHGLN